MIGPRGIAAGTARWRFGGALPFLLGACGGVPERFEDCSDADCRQTWVSERFDGKAGSVDRQVRQIQDPLEQEAVVLSLASHGAADLGPLCDLLHGPAARARCVEKAQRHHLWVTDSVGRPLSERPGGGPATQDEVPRVSIPSVYTDAQPVQVTCTEKVGIECATDRAVIAAAAGRTAEAAGICVTVDDERWRNECRFRAAEAIWALHTPSALSEATELCLSAGEFVAPCLGHGARELGLLTPPSTVARRERWAAFIVSVETLRAWWDAHDPSYTSYVLGRVWSEGLLHAFAQADQVTGDVLAVVPVEMTPHVHSAAAYRLEELEFAQARPLAAEVDRLEAALDSRSSEEAADRDVHTLGAINYWEGDVDAADARIPAVFYLGTARRAWSKERRVDLTLAVLEAGARGQRASLARVREAVVHPDPTVAWTALRLLKSIEVNGHRQRGRPPTGSPGPGGPDAAGRPRTPPSGTPGPGSAPPGG